MSQDEQTATTQTKTKPNILEDGPALEKLLDEAFDEEVSPEVAAEVAAAKEAKDGKTPTPKRKPTESRKPARATIESPEEEAASDPEGDEEGAEEVEEEVADSDEDAGEVGVADEDEGLTEAEIQALTDAGVPAIRMMKINRMPPEQRQAVVEAIVESSPPRKKSDSEAEVKKELKVTSEMIEKIAGPLPEKILKNFAEKLGVEVEDVRELALGIRDAAVTPLVKTTQALVGAIQEQRDYSTVIVYGVAARNVQMRLSVEYPELADQRKFEAIAGDPATFNLADGYAQQGMSLVEAAERAITERIQTRYGKKKGTRKTTKKPRRTPQDSLKGSAEAGSRAKKVFKGRKPESEMTEEELLDSAFDEMLERERS